MDSHEWYKIELNDATNSMKFIDLKICYKIEPVNSLAPKVSQADKLNIPRVHEGDSLSLLCPITSFPVGLFR